MGMKAVRFVGLNRDVWIPDDIEVIIDIVPSWRTNIRSNQPFSGQTKTTWHDTGNPNSDAWGERNWLHSGAGGSYVGYNFAFDAERIIQLTPLNEVTWHAGTPEGNKYSWGAEQCLNTDWNRALRVGAALHGGLCAAMGWSVDEALVQHYVWYGKHCPAQIRNRGLWPTVVQMTREAAARALQAANGAIIPTPAIGAINVGDTFAAVKDTGIRKGWGTASPVSFWIAKGTKGTRIDGDIKEANGLAWINVSVDGKGTGWGVLMDFTKVASASTPVFDGTKDVTINGNVYHADKRTITLTANTNVRQWASTESKVLRVIPAGASEAVLGWVKGQNVDGIDKWWITRDGRVWSGTTR